MKYRRDRRYLIYNKNGGYSTIEALITIGFSVVLLAVFFSSITNFYTVYDRPDIDLNAKSIDILEMLLGSPGQGLNNNRNWEDAVDDAETLGLGTDPTVEYGIYYVTSNGNIIIFSRYSFSNDIGIVENCFLAGTKVLMADDTYKNIEEINEGDIVRCYDKESNEFTSGIVTKVFYYTEEEILSDHYLVINKQLCVTLDHKFYLNGEWIRAEDLKIGDKLFSSLTDGIISSIEKIYEKKPLYDLEIAVYHNYFVAMDTINVLVHNAAKERIPIAEFTWFDCDGPFNSGQDIAFDASLSENLGNLEEAKYTWWFNWSPGSGFMNGFEVTGDPTIIHKYGDNEPHLVKLMVTAGSESAEPVGSDMCIYIVQANKFIPPDINPDTETDLAFYFETGNTTFMPYDENHYVEYTPLNIVGPSTTGYYLYEIKEKTNSPYMILDYDKITSLMGVYYYTAKSSLGFDTQENSVYDFNIAISGSNTQIVPSYGATYDSSNIVALYTSSREVIIYHPPQDLSMDYMINFPEELPYYEKGRITVRVFIGGEAPNYPPFTPHDPDPANGATLVPWTKTLSWIGGDPNGDPVKYDVYFGTTNPPITKVSDNQSGTTYDPPGEMEPGTKYFWQIIAWENQNNSTASPVWSFTTHPNRNPDTPRDPTPAHSSTEIPVTDVVLSWICDGDPDEIWNDTVTYDIFFGTLSPSGSGEGPGGSETFPLTLILNDTTNTYCNLLNVIGEPRLKYYEKYSWRVIAKDKHGGYASSPIWNFTTAEKGLDQYNTKGSDEGLNTPGQYLGQTLIVGKTGSLTKINLSLNHYFLFPPMFPENIEVAIYEGEDPEAGVGEWLSGATIPSWDEPSNEYIWKNVTLNKPINVTEGEPLFIVVNSTEIRDYIWEHSGSVMSSGGGTEPQTPTPGYNYPDGMPYISPDGTNWQRAEEEIRNGDFLFKTYVFRTPELDQPSQPLEQPGIGIELPLGLAQTFTPEISGDLMKVNLSLIFKSGTPHNLNVTIIEGMPNKENNEVLAYGIIEAFSDDGSFVWKEVNFSVYPPYLEAGELYSIIIEPDFMGSMGNYLWEYIDGVAYTGMGFSYDGFDWNPVRPEIDFIFATYMDEID